MSPSGASRTSSSFTASARSSSKGDSDAGVVLKVLPPRAGAQARSGPRRQGALRRRTPPPQLRERRPFIHAGVHAVQTRSTVGCSAPPTPERVVRATRRVWTDINRRPPAKTPAGGSAGPASTRAYRLHGSSRCAPPSTCSDSSGETSRSPPKIRSASSAASASAGISSVVGSFVGAFACEGGATRTLRWAIQDSNLGPLPYQRSALTD